jgi:hypothetical protein
VQQDETLACIGKVQGAVNVCILLNANFIELVCEWCNIGLTNGCTLLLKQIENATKFGLNLRLLRLKPFKNGRVAAGNFAKLDLPLTYGNP